MHSRCASLRERTATFSPFISSKPIILKATALPTLVITAMSFAISPVLEYSVSDCGIIPRIGPSSKNSSFPFSPSLQKEAIPSSIFPFAFARSSDDTDAVYSLRFVHIVHWNSSVFFFLINHIRSNCSLLRFLCDFLFGFRAIIETELCNAVFLLYLCYICAIIEEKRRQNGAEQKF